MSEPGTSEQYKGLTPPQLNARLGEFFNVMPTSDVVGLDTTLQTLTSTPDDIENFGRAVNSFQAGVQEDSQRRLQAEPLERLQSGLRNLLSVSHLSSPASLELVERYSSDFALGLHRYPDQSDLAKMLGVNIPNYPGPFSVDSAKVIEDELFEAKTRKLERLEFVQLSRSSGGAHNMETISKGEENLKRMREHLEIWQKDRTKKSTSPNKQK